MFTVIISFILKHWKLGGSIAALMLSFYLGHYFTVVFHDAAMAKKMQIEQNEKQDIINAYNKLNSETATLIEQERNRSFKLNQELSDAKKKYTGPNCVLPADGLQYLKNKARVKIPN